MGQLAISKEINSTSEIELTIVDFLFCLSVYSDYSETRVSIKRSDLR